MVETKVNSNVELKEIPVTRRPRYLDGTASITSDFGVCYAVAHAG